MVEQGPILHLSEVTLARGGRALFADLSLTLRAGEAAVVTGPNGVGKSSLLRLAAGLLRADAGQVTVAGTCALLGEATALDGEAALAAALGFWARMDGAREPAERVAEALDALALSPLADVPVRLLSAGQRRRAGLARVLASRAALWLLDEPANGLDAGSVTRLEALIAAHRAGGGAVMLATHQPVAVGEAVEVDLGKRALTPALDIATTSVRPELVEACPERPAVPASRRGLPFSAEERTVLRQAQHERERGDLGEPGSGARGERDRSAGDEGTGGSGKEYPQP